MVFDCLIHTYTLEGNVSSSAASNGDAVCYARFRFQMEHTNILYLYDPFEIKTLFFVCNYVKYTFGNSS